MKNGQVVLWAIGGTLAFLAVTKIAAAHVPVVGTVRTYFI